MICLSDQVEEEAIELVFVETLERGVKLSTYMYVVSSGVVRFDFCRRLHCNLEFILHQQTCF